MSYLVNAWYAAAWSDEIAQVPFARTILDQPLVFYRDSAGRPIALFDTCPHRFAPLSLGRVDGDRITCGYHGLQFGPGGVCLRNPHGKGVVTSALSVRAYRVEERYGLVWTWMGNAVEADPALLPIIPALAKPDLTWVKGSLHVPANYQLIIDNLLDLTHVEFLHPFLSSPGNSERTKVSAKQEGDRVSALYDIHDEPVSGLFQLFWTSSETVCNMHVRMNWEAPATLSQVNMVYPPSGTIDQSIELPFAHILTPESEDTTHYFWTAGRALAKDNDALSGEIQAGIQNAFESQDEPMIRAVRSRMKSNDLLAHRPAALPIDEASIRARRILQRLIAEQQEVTSQHERVTA